MSVVGGEAENIHSVRVFRILTLNGRSLVLPRTPRFSVLRIDPLSRALGLAADAIHNSGLPLDLAQRSFLLDAGR
jgi:hypothetical protein